MIHCYDMRCKYCNDKYKCTNKNIELNYVGINTKYQGFRNLLECKSFEYSELYKNAIEFISKMEENK